MLTALEWEKKKKREEELWKRTLAYFMYQEIVVKPQLKAEAEMYNAYTATSRFIVTHGLLNRLFEKKGNEPSPAEMLAEIGQFEPPDSPFGELFQEMKKKPLSEKHLHKALQRVIVEEPSRMILAAEKERERYTEWQRAQRENKDVALDYEPVDKEHVRYMQMLEKKMLFLRTVMPPELFKQLEHKIEAGEYKLDPKVLNDHEKQQEKQKKEQERSNDYQNYIRQKRVDPKEKAGKLANAGDVYSAAAYMIAAHEQKDDPNFDPEKADARAMELSGSRAFKSYMKGHPGNLVAAARGTALEETSNGVAALDADLTRRDKILTNTRDNLKKMIGGKSESFRKMLNALDRFVNEDTEPSKEETTNLLSAIGTYITTDCSPRSREYNKECFTQAMCSAKALLPDKDFDKVVDMVNVGRSPKVKSADFDDPGIVAEKTKENPTLELVRRKNTD